MAVLACAIALARDTTGHDWYAAARITVADLLIFAGFDEDAPVEYRSARGVIETITRDRLSYTFEARWAREDILETAWNGAMLGWISGLGGALLALVLIRRSMGNRRTWHTGHKPSVPAPQPEARERLVPSQEKPMSPPASAGAVSGSLRAAAAAPVRALPDQSPAAGSPGPGKPDPAVTRRSEPADGKDRTEPARRGRRKRTYGRWI